MQKILIDGSFIDKKITGVQRFCWEVLKQLATKCPEKVAICVAESVDTSKITNLGIEIIKKGKKNNKFWQFITLGKVAKKYNYKLLCMANLSPLFKKDYLVLHDVTFLENEGNNNKFWALKYKIFVTFNIYKHKKIFTVSNFSKERILKYYKKFKNEDVIVCGNGYTNFDGTESNLDYKDYYLSVGSSSNNKNFNYIIALAKANPDKEFIITGKLYGDLYKEVENIKNMKMLGYVSTTDLKYLYKNCNAFILPSTYEGFGLPPLEAISNGCKKLFLSNIPPFIEIYDDTATFFNPLDYDNLVNLDKGFMIDEESIKAILNKYSWDNCSNIILEEMSVKYDT